MTELIVGATTMLIGVITGWAMAKVSGEEKATPPQGRENDPSS